MARLARSKHKKKSKKTGKFPPAVEMGRRGGRIGGVNRASVLSKKRRRDIAIMGGRAKAARG